MNDEKIYPINYKGKTYNTSIHKDLSDEEFEQIRIEYYAKPPKEEVLKQLKKVSEGGMKLNHITNYYVKDLMAKTKVHYNNWTIEEALNYKPLMEFFAGKCEVNKKVFPQDKSLAHNIETAFRLCGFKTASKPANFPIKACDDILNKYNVNGNYYDFSCGWGVRLLSALRNNVNYYGTDPNYILCERLNEIAKDYKSVCSNDSVVDIRSHGSEEFVHEWENTIGLAFTSPPYYNLEDYKIGNQSYKDGVSYEEWKQNYFTPTIKNIYRYLIDDGVMAININNFNKYNDYDLIGDTIDIAKSIGFELENTHDLKNITRCYGNKNDKGNTKFYDNNEKIFVFRKLHISNMEKDFERFKNRECKAKDIFYIKEISKTNSYEFVRKYHYLGDAKFFCVQAFGLFYKGNDELVGCATYQQPQGIAALKSWFGLTNATKNIYELGRLCMLPSLNGTNATSFLLGGSIKELRRQNEDEKKRLKKLGMEFTKDDWVCRAVITLACSERHVGSIYQVCNFKYYGLTNKASDFYREDGKVNPRGKSGSWNGVYLPRARKHRYAFILDDSLKCNYEEQTKPTIDETIELDCCHGTNEVYDPRFNRWYTCPRCTGKLERIFKTEDEDVKKVEEKKTIKFETDKMIDLASLMEKEPQLFEELAKDYPCEKATYIFEVVS